jgi:hypothetical protein
VARKTAPVEKTQGGARATFTDKQVAHIESTILEKIPQGWTIRQVLAEPDMCSMTYLYRDLLPFDEDFSKQYARAFELRNEFWAEEMVEIADDGRNDWMTRTYGDTEVDVPNPEVGKRSQIRIETRKWLMGKSQPKKYGDKTIVSGDPDPPSRPYSDSSDKPLAELLKEERKMRDKLKDVANGFGSLKSLANIFGFDSFTQAFLDKAEKITVGLPSAQMLRIKFGRLGGLVSAFRK